MRHWREWSSRRDAKNIRETLPELEKAIAEVGGDDTASQILGRETLLKAREFVEAWSDSRDWIDLKVEQKVGLNAYAAQKIAGTPKEAAAILRRYAADAKKADQPEPRPTENDATPQANETKSAPLVDRAALPELKGSDKQRSWAADIREKTLDELESVDVSAVVREQTESALKSFRKRTAHLPPEKRAGYDKSRKLGVASLGQIPSDICAKLEAAIAERGEAAVFAELEATTREIAAELLTETDASRWIDRRDLRPVGYLRGKKIFERWAKNADAQANKERETVVPFEPVFSPRAVEFVESVKKSGEFWPDQEKPTNGPRLKKGLEKALRQAEKEGFSKEEVEEARQALLHENGLRNKRVALDVLEKEGRELPPLEKRDPHRKIKDTGQGLPASVQELPLDEEIVGPCSVDLYGKDGQWKQRRWYDANGNVEMDYDETHRPGITHVFPHVHIWKTVKKPSKNGDGLDEARERMEPATPWQRINKNDKLEE